MLCLSLRVHHLKSFEPEPELLHVGGKVEIRGLQLGCCGQLVSDCRCGLRSGYCSTHILYTHCVVLSLLCRLRRGGNTTDTFFFACCAAGTSVDCSCCVYVCCVAPGGFFASIREGALNCTVINPSFDSHFMIGHCLGRMDVGALLLFVGRCSGP